jgi:hypothetical protein
MPSRERLNSWKEIAAVLGRSVRTVERWEKTLGLPVYRLTGGKRGIIFAFADEIEAWMKTSSRALEANGISDGSSGPQAANGAPTLSGGQAGLAGGMTEAVTPASRSESRQNVPGEHYAEATEAQRTQSQGKQEIRPGRFQWRRVFRRRWIQATAPATVLIVVTVAVMLPLREPPQPAHLRLADDSVIVLDAGGKQIWRHHFMEGIDEAYYQRGASSSFEYPQASIEDLDGDGSNEVLMIVWHGRSLPSPFVCFESDGRVRFMRTVAFSPRHGDQVSEPPFSASLMRVTSNPDGSKTLWLVSQHTKWFAAVLEKIDDRGELLAQYWSNGHINSIQEGRWQGRRAILVGAMFNDGTRVSLAALDYERPGGSAPAQQAKYRCQNCPPGEPLAFLVFPRTELSRMLEDRPAVSEMRVQADGGILLTTANGTFSVEAGKEISHGDAIYTLDSHFRITGAETGNQYRMIHNRLELVGRIKHVFRPEEDAELFPVLEWRNGEFVAITHAGTNAPSTQQAPIKELARSVRPNP